MEIFKLHGIKISNMGLCSYKGSINTVKSVDISFLVLMKINTNFLYTKRSTVFVLLNAYGHDVNCALPVTYF